MHKRAQTANPDHKHKHQETILMEIKTALQMDKIEQARGEEKETPQMRMSTKYSKSYKSSKRNSPFTKKIKEIERLNAKDGRSVFSLEKD